MSGFAMSKEEIRQQMQQAATSQMFDGHAAMSGNLQSLTQPKEPGLCEVVKMLRQRVDSLHSSLGPLEVAFVRVLGGFTGQVGESSEKVKEPESIDAQLRLLLQSLANLEGRINTLGYQFNEKL